MSNKYTIDTDTLKELYYWIDSIPLSRSKKNISRDFSDGVLAAEILKNFFKKLIDLHNYPPSHNLKQKLNNWNLMKKKVFIRINFKVKDDLLEDIVNCKDKAIEFFLNKLKTKIENFDETQNFTNSKINTTVNNNNNILQNNYKKCDETEIHNYQNKSPKTYNNVYKNNEPNNQLYFNSITNEYKNKQISDYEKMIIERDNIIQSLKETLEIVELKNKKLEELLNIKEQKIHDLQNN